MRFYRTVIFVTMMSAPAVAETPSVQSPNAPAQVATPKPPCQPDDYVCQGAHSHSSSGSGQGGGITNYPTNEKTLNPATAPIK
jgi:hypothetical protein